MKSIQEIETMLLDEIWNSLDKIKLEVNFYNEILGDTSFLLAGLLGALLKSNDDWSIEKWVDDGLLTDVRLNKNKLSIGGFMIWGVEGTTDQWADPFYFEIELADTKSIFNKYTFLLGDLNKPEISYEEFRINRHYWNEGKRDWKYIINR